MKTTKIKYKKKELEVKFGIKEQLVFNKLCNKIFKGDTLEDNFYMFYASVIVALGKQPPMDEFCNYCDDNPNEFAKYMEYLADIFTDVPEVKEVKLP